MNRTQKQKVNQVLVALLEHIKATHGQELWEEHTLRCDNDCPIVGAIRLVSELEESIRRNTDKPANVDFFYLGL